MYHGELDGALPFFKTLVRKNKKTALPVAVDTRLGPAGFVAWLAAGDITVQSPLGASRLALSSSPVIHPWAPAVRRCRPPVSSSPVVLPLMSSSSVILP